MTWYSVLKAVHLLSAVIWVGGMFFAYAVLRPAITVLDPPQRMTLHKEVFRRFFLIVWHAMPLQILTGYAMIFAGRGGMAGLSVGINIMMLLGLIMAAIFATIFFGPYRAFRAAPAPAPMARIRRLIGVNLVLGLATILAATLL